MNTKDLVTIWGAPEPPRLTPKQISIRLPITVSAEISALCEMYPKKSKTEIISDLLTSALEQLEKDLPVIETDEEIGMSCGEPEYYTYGPGIEFKKLTAKYLRILEEELGIAETDQNSKQNDSGEDN